MLFSRLMLVSLALAIVTGMPLGTIVSSFETGTGNTLGHIAIVVGLGTMLGKMMAESGASDRIAETLIQLFGERRVPWSMMCAALVVGLPVFFEVGFVLLIPIAFTVARRTRTSLILVGLPMLAGLSVVHGTGSAASGGDAGGYNFSRRRGTDNLIRPAGRHSQRDHRRPDLMPTSSPPGLCSMPKTPWRNSFPSTKRSRVARLCISWPLFCCRWC